MHPCAAARAALQCTLQGPCAACIELSGARQQPSHHSHLAGSSTGQQEAPPKPALPLFSFGTPPPAAGAAAAAAQPAAEADAGLSGQGPGIAGTPALAACTGSASVGFRGHASVGRVQARSGPSQQAALGAMLCASCSSLPLSRALCRGVPSVSAAWGPAQLPDSCHVRRCPHAGACRSRDTSLWAATRWLAACGDRRRANYPGAKPITIPVPAQQAGQRRRESAVPHAQGHAEQRMVCLAGLALGTNVCAPCTCGLG